MSEIFYILIAAMIGTIMGSFVGAQVWRFRVRHLADDKKRGEDYDKNELKRLAPLLDKKLNRDRSQCLDCGMRLRWFDMIPVVSWIALRGKCRKCKKSIGSTEFLLELTMGALFGLSVAFWPASLDQPLEMAKLIIWLFALVPLAINFVYDLKWMSLISYCNWAVIGLGLIYATLVVVQAGGDWVVTLLSVGASVLVLGGLYGLLWVISRGKWVGDGDIYLGAGLGLLLADWRVAIVGLFLANLIGTLIVLPGMIGGKLSRQSQVPFGPLLIAGCIIAWFIGQPIVNWYQSMLMIV